MGRKQTETYSNRRNGLCEGPEGKRKAVLSETEKFRIENPRRESVQKKATTRQGQREKHEPDHEVCISQSEFWDLTQKRVESLQKASLREVTESNLHFIKIACQRQCGK